jgi:integrase
MKKWVQAAENLLRNADSGKYYVRIEHDGRDVWKSLKTTKLAVAKLKKAGAIDKIRAASGTLSRDNLTLGECVAAYLAGKRDQGLKDSSYTYCALSVQMIRAHFKGFDAKLAQDFTPYDTKVLCDRLRNKYSPQRFNGIIYSLRGILEVAVKSKVIKENPARKSEVRPEKIHRKKLELPAEEKIEVLMDYLRKHRQKEKNGTESPKREPASFDAFLFLTLMVESSARPGSIRLLRPEHVNLKRGTVDWVPFKHSKTVDTLPMTRKMKAVFRLLLRRHSGRPQDPLLPIKSPRKALLHACAAVGITPPLTPHKFRHICSTRMAERNVPYALAAQWRRDTDGGGTFMRVYVHPRNESLRAVVKALEQREADAKVVDQPANSIPPVAKHGK